MLPMMPGAPPNVTFCVSTRTLPPPRERLLSTKTLMGVRGGGPHPKGAARVLYATVRYEDL